MSRLYSITAVINLKFNEKKLLEVLTKSKELGWKIYKPNWEINDPFKLEELDLKAALLRILEKPKNDINGLELRVEDMFFAVYFQRNHLEIGLTFCGFNYFPWMRKFKYDDYDDEYDEDIDIARYLRLMLDLIEDYKILELRVEKD